MKKRLAIFDFCDTIISFQTADAFVDFVLFGEKVNPPFMIRMFKNLTFNFKMIPGFIRKRLVLYQLKGMSEKKLEIAADEFVRQRLVDKENPAIITEMEKAMEAGLEVIIISGGYSIYVSRYAAMKNILKSIATDFLFRDALFSGLIKGKDCMGRNKITRLKEELNLSEYDLEESVVYSDSFSDKPLFDLVGKAYFVKGNEMKLLPRS